MIDQSKRDHAITDGPKNVETKLRPRPKSKEKERKAPTGQLPNSKQLPPPAALALARVAVTVAPPNRRRTPRRQQQPFRSQQQPELRNPKGAGRDQPRR